MKLALPRILTCVGVASLLAACSSSPATVPAPADGARAPQSLGSQIAPSSAMRAIDRKKTKSLGLEASPASLAFAAADTAARTIAITGERDGRYDVSIAGTGTCPAVSPASLKLAKRDEEHGEHGRGHDHQDSDEAVGTITVTPASSGPGGVVRGGGGSGAAWAQCTITVAAHDRDASDDNAEHEREHSATPLLIPVTVGSAATPSPVPTLAPTPVPTPTPCVTNRGGLC